MVIVLLWMEDQQFDSKFWIFNFKLKQKLIKLNIMRNSYSNTRKIISLLLKMVQKLSRFLSLCNWFKVPITFNISMKRFWLILINNDTFLQYCFNYFIVIFHTLESNSKSLVFRDNKNTHRSKQDLPAYVKLTSKSRILISPEIENQNNLRLVNKDCWILGILVKIFIKLPCESHRWRQWFLNAIFNVASKRSDVILTIAQLFLNNFFLIFFNIYNL